MTWAAWEEDVAEYVTKLLTEGMPRPRVTALMRVGEDGVTRSIHVSVALDPKPPGEPGTVHPIRSAGVGKI